ncbi:hypothetical protein CY34DRAFT_814371 [Suillus luteus UH-Slu-Lm8-n1]|uniref:Uncharacterized protein n=1 Tax=Suillus luteus UH-Slu-Lm8-n1 TaxID=930992 RepID=A0A0D0ADD8_9AGAM|nr:hypothetical protein CY34DRAFT_814371 [Suillus luteus UH-Slu-Lm8-n1]
MLIIKLLVWCDFTIQSMTVMHPTTTWMGAPCAIQVAVVKYKDGHSAMISSLKKLRADADDTDGVHHMIYLFTWIPTYSQFNLKLCHGVEAKEAVHVCSSCRTWTRCIRSAFVYTP